MKDENTMDNMIENAMKMMENATASQNIPKISIQFIVNGHLITLGNINPVAVAKIESLKKALKKKLKTDGNIQYLDYKR